MCIRDRCYENHPINHKPENGYFNSWNVRAVAYWSVFAGGAGFTYGGNGVWQMDKTGKPPLRETHFTQTWDQALDLEGAGQMRYLRQLIESRPFLSRIPDDGNTLLISDPGKEKTRIQVTLGSDRSWAMFYITSGQLVTVNLANIRGPLVKAWWYNPRDGKTYNNEGILSDQPSGLYNIDVKRQEFNPPGEEGENNDWILVIDQQEKNFPVPGRTRY